MKEQINTDIEYWKKTESGTLDSLNSTRLKYIDFHLEFCKLLIGISSAVIGFGTPLLSDKLYKYGIIKVYFTLSVLLFLFVVILLLIHLLISLKFLYFLNDNKFKHLKLIRKFIKYLDDKHLIALDNSSKINSNIQKYIRQINNSIFLSALIVFGCALYFMYYFIMILGKQ